MPTSFELEEARDRWRRLAAEDAGLSPISRFHLRRLERITERPAPQVSLRLSSEGAADAIRSGQPLLLAGALDVDLDEVAAELRATALELRESARGPASVAARAIATAPLSLEEALAAILRGDDAAIEARAFSLDLPLDAFRSLLELAVQPVLWACAEQGAALTDLTLWRRGYCPICGAWPLYGELVGAQRERHLRCGRCGVSWSWAVLLCPYCGNDDHRTLGQLENPDEREQLRVDVCERCQGYLKGLAAFTPVGAAQLSAEDAATVYLDLAAQDRGYARPGRTTDVANAGVPRGLLEASAREPTES